MTAAYLNNSSSNTSQISDIISSGGGIEGSSDNNGFSSKVKGVISMDGGIYHKEWITPNGPPFLAYRSLQNNTILIDYSPAPANGIFFSIDGDRLCYNYDISQGIPAVLLVSSGNSNYSKYDTNNYTKWITKALPIFLKQLVCGEIISVETPTAEIKADFKVSLFPNLSEDIINLTVDNPA